MVVKSLCGGQLGERIGNLGVLTLGKPHRRGLHEKQIIRTCIKHSGDESKALGLLILWAISHLGICLCYICMHNVLPVARINKPEIKV